jgi:hypothetical protein
MDDLISAIRKNKLHRMVIISSNAFALDIKNMVSHTKYGMIFKCV